MESRSGAMLCAGFMFWLATAYFIYHQNFLGVLSLTAAVIVGAGIWRLFSYTQRRRPEPPRQSDLPADYDFKDIKPKDFE